MRHYVIIDFEMCGVRRQNRKNLNIQNEIIQIGVTLLNDGYHA